jgi:hypothetical protein
MKNGAPTPIPSDVMADLEAAARYATTGEADPETLRRIAEGAEAVRRAILAKHGEVDIGVDIIRSLRDS